MSAPRAAILAPAGPVLGPEEAAFFRDADPWGFIVFARNVETPDQTRRLTAALREAVGRDAPVFVDQEGGRVQRLRAPHWQDWAWIPRLEGTIPEAALTVAIRHRHEVMAAELRAVGIDADCAPMLDVARPGAHPIVADRVLGPNAGLVARRGRAAAEALLAGGVLPVVKHMPGHGRATVDSHLGLPVVDASLEALRAVDLAPFRALADLPMGMTAHVVFTAIDPDRPATLSPAAIRLIREEIGFDGLLMTDDIGMGALDGGFQGRAAAAVAAGCDVVLHCSGDRAEMTAVVSGAPRLAGDARRRAEAALARRAEPAPLDVEESRRRHAYLIGETSNV